MTSKDSVPGDLGDRLLQSEEEEISLCDYRNSLLASGGPPEVGLFGDGIP
jgi:hypothetical protein